MRLYCVYDRVVQGPLLLYWGKVKESLADYFTKHHPEQITMQSVSPTSSSHKTQENSPVTCYIMTFYVVLNTYLLKQMYNGWAVSLPQPKR